MPFIQYQYLARIRAFLCPTGADFDPTRAVKDIDVVLPIFVDGAIFTSEVELLRLDPEGNSEIIFDLQAFRLMNYGASRLGVNEQTITEFTVVRPLGSENLTVILRASKCSA